MANKRPSWFPLNPLSFLGDLSCGMSPAAAGAYMRLVCKAWLQVPPATIPDNDDWMAQASGFPSTPDFLGCKQAVLSGWTPCADGRLTLPWLREAYDHAASKSRQARDAAKVKHASAERTHNGRNADAGYACLHLSGFPPGVISKGGPGETPLALPAAFEAFNRWSVVGRGCPLNAAHNEPQRVEGWLLETVATGQHLPLDGIQVNPLVGVPHVIDHLIAKGTEWKRGRNPFPYAFACVLSSLDDWRVSGRPPGEGGETGAPGGAPSGTGTGKRRGATGLARHLESKAHLESLSHKADNALPG